MKSSHIAFLWGIIFLSLIGVQALLVSKSGRCSCIDVSEGRIQKRTILRLEQLPPGPLCSNTEIIATLKNGMKKCLDPDSPYVKNLVKTWKKMVNSKGNKKKKPKAGNKKRQIKNAEKAKKTQHVPIQKTV
ncbi:C-X-C motif chemokine 9 [Dromiciops gliroides]|uniref:C-X-C motif chemokine 9 n=1 Tax=Dromiciops gliroides TaxID=33562 RepID=UPI001CC5197E|nr:C-X-C motif chemokine 9 [Dromiciops gliroides]